MNNYLVVEGKTNKILMEALLPKDVLAKTEIVEGGEYTSSLAIGRSIYVSGNKKVLVAIEANSNDEIEISDKYNFIKNYFSMVYANSEIKAILFKPEIEHIFFSDKPFIESFVGKKIDDETYMLAERDPKFYLNHFANGNGDKPLHERLLNALKEENKQAILESEELREIIDFIKN